MKLTTEQSMQIAKMWGWRRIGNSHSWEQKCPKGGISWEPIPTADFPIGESIGCGPYMTTKFLRESVLLSWEGFGKTIEAIERISKDRPFNIDINATSFMLDSEKRTGLKGNAQCITRFSNYNSGVQFCERIKRPKTSIAEAIITSTHLAALEALDQK